MNRADYITAHKFLTRMAEDLADGKCQDYGGQDDILQNFINYQGFGIKPLQGILSRMVDKMSRLGNHAAGQQFKTDDTLDDTIVDLINYAVLYYCMTSQGAKDEN